jgi:hypothetical protein
MKKPQNVNMHITQIIISSNCCDCIRWNTCSKEVHGCTVFLQPGQTVVHEFPAVKEDLLLLLLPREYRSLLR